MVIDILNLRTVVFDTVCRFLKNRTILRLREVSKTLKKVLEHTILTTQKTQVFILKFETMNACRKLTLHFWDREHSIWNFSLLTKLGFDGITKSYRTLEVVLKPEETADLLTFLGPLIKQATFWRISFYDDQTEIIQALSKFVAKDSVEFLRVHELRSKSSNFVTWFDFVKKINQQEVEYAIDEITKDSVRSLTLLADIVKGMSVGVNKGFADNTEEREIEIVQMILSRKCDNLAYYVSFNNHRISACHAAKMLTFFHRLGKKVVFETIIDQDSMELQIGNYNLKMRNFIPGSTNCTIRHVDVNIYA